MFAFFQVFLFYLYSYYYFLVANWIYKWISEGKQTWYKFVGFYILKYIF